MEKKSVLFVNFSLHSGGIEKSLVTLLHLFDYEKYDVDLQLFADEGLFLPRVPEQVNHLPSLFPPNTGCRSAGRCPPCCGKRSRLSRCAACS